MKTPLVDMRTALTTPKVIERTGIPRLHLSSMIHANQLVSLTRSNGVLWAKHKFSVRDVDALMERVFAGSQEVSDPLPGACGIMEVRARAVCSVREVIALVLGGRLSWKGRLAGRHDYMALMLVLRWANARKMASGIGVHRVFEHVLFL